MNKAPFIAAALLVLSVIGCEGNNTSDRRQQSQQEALLAEATSQVGMPAIKNFRERKILKDILELRDQAGLVTYTYTVSEITGKLRYFGETIGYGIPYATQFTSPEKDIYYGTASSVHMAMPQADPNGLFSPAAADGTWVLMKDPKGDKVLPVYLEPRIVVSPFKLPESILAKD